MKVKDITDKVIRFEFIKRNLDFFRGDNKEFVNEYGINSSNVIDLASFDFNKNIFYGFEIKSARDNLKRLKKQLSNYITFFNIVYIVAYDRHLEGIEEIINSDLKVYEVENKKIAISQVITLNSEDILNKKDKYIIKLNEMSLSKCVDILILCVTDILKNGSYIFYNESSNTKLSEAFDTEIYEGYFNS